MQNSFDTGAKRPVILYIIIAIALFAALILTVRWAKSRADFHGQQAGQSQTAVDQPEEGQPQGTPEEQQPADSSSQQAPVASTPQPTQPQAPQSNESAQAAPTPRTVASTGPPVVQSVPATGPEQLVLPTISLSAFVFAVLSYARARRRFAAQALTK